MLIRCCDLCKATPADEYHLATEDTQVDIPSGRTEIVVKSVDLCPECTTKALKHMLSYKPTESWRDVQAKCYKYFVLSRKQKVDR